MTHSPAVRPQLAAQNASARYRAQSTATGLPAAMTIVTDPAQQAQQQPKHLGRQMQIQMRRVLQIQHESPAQQAHQRKQVRKQRQQHWQPWMLRFA